MLCDDCKKNEACVHIVQISPEGKIDKNLCESCAAKYGNLMLQPEKNVSMNDFLKGIFSGGQKESTGQDIQEMVCPHCGMSYSDFLHTGKIGCSVCYQTFRHQLEPIIRRIHRASIHSGKIPHRSGGALELKHSLEQLRQKLESCVASEEYEKAAQYRDKIRAMEKALSDLPGKEAK